MKTNALYLLVCILLSILSVNAQSADGFTFQPEPVAKHYSDIAFSELSVGIGITSMGITAEASSPLTPNLQLRAGINFFKYNSKYYDGTPDDPRNELSKTFGYRPDLTMKGKLNMFHGHALVDFYPVKGGLFFVSGGLYMGNNKVDLHGYLIDKDGERANPLEGEEWPTLDFQGNVIDINNGNIDAQATVGNVIKPYLGFGIGRAISKSRLGFTFELGMMYQGDYTIKQGGSKVAFELDENVEYDEEAEKWLNRIKWWPKVSFQLKYRIF
ncbi:MULTISPECIES: hypothetical protein [Myroides]|uniref:Outer membrane protein beta-barrel domain-containing protein n=1 Tax=Myroides albus TaxID=2562892 RepID=A0A6I3LKP7_9FLAO|nr:MULTISPECIES: hypothetical protein [Myroides]MTG96742.1 hypothetical protein [Myroides albus]MVX35616.1 hypothetical protein [Myroides sp. LoEW2-1]UVD80847.1 hypothetical protein NWE55_06285 [Myroides albus]